MRRWDRFGSFRVFRDRPVSAAPCISWALLVESVNFCGSVSSGGFSRGWPLVAVGGFDVPRSIRFQRIWRRQGRFR